MPAEQISTKTGASPRYTVQPLEDKPDQLHVDVITPYREANNPPLKPLAPPVATAQAVPVPPINNTTVVVNNPPPAPAPIIVNNPPPAASVLELPALIPVIPAPSPAPDYDALTCWEIRVARNEIFAHHGYVFKNHELSDYFSRRAWYHPVITEVSAISLSPVELRVIDTLRAAEARKSCGQ